MKKILCFVLTLVFFVTGAFASPLAQKPSSEEASCMISNESLFEEIFSSNTSYVTRSAVPDVDYSFTVSYNDNRESADVQLNFTINSSIAHHFSVSGTIPYVLLPDGTIYIEGPLYGNNIINNVLYDVIVGFQTIKGHSGIGASVTIFNPSNDPVSPLYIYFGNFQKTDAVHALAECNANIAAPTSFASSTSSSPVTYSSTLQLTTLSTGTSNFNPTTGSGGMTSAPKSQKLTLSFDPGERVALLELNTYTSNINRNTFTIDVPLNVTVYDTSVTFKNVSTNDSRASIYRFYQLPCDQYTASNSTLRNLFIAILTDIANAKGLSTSTLSLFLPDARGSVNASINATHQTATFSMDITNHSDTNNFNSTAMPVSYEVMSTSDGNFRFQGCANTTYRVDCVIGTYYVPSSTVTTSGTLPIRN